MAWFILLVCSCTRVCPMISYTVILCDVNSTLGQLYAMFYSLYPTDLMIFANIRSFSTVRSRCIVVIFLRITHDKNPIARPSGQGMQCRSWVQVLIEVLLLKLLRCARHQVIYDLNILRVHSMWYLWFQLTLSNVWYNSEHLLVHTNRFKFPLSGMTSMIIHRLSKDSLLKYMEDCESWSVFWHVTHVIFYDDSLL